MSDYLDRADSLMKEGRNGEAADLLRRHAVGRLGDVAFMHKLGTAAYRAGDYDLAERAYGVNAASPSPAAISQYSHAIALEKLGRMAEARAAYEAAHATDQNYVPARDALVRLNSSVARPPAPPVSPPAPPDRSYLPAGAPPEIPRSPLDTSRNEATQRGAIPAEHKSEKGMGADDFTGIPGFNIPKDEAELAFWHERYRDQERARWWTDNWGKLPGFAKAGKVLLGAIVVGLAAWVAWGFISWQIDRAAQEDQQDDRQIAWCQDLRDRFGENIPPECRE